MELFIVGLKHSGKTTLAKNLGMDLSVKCADADVLALARLGGKTVREYYSDNGADAFRKIEMECVKDFLEENESFILSLGGGAADNKGLMDAIRKKGKIVYIHRPEELLLGKIIEKSGIPPFLDKDDPVGSFHALFLRRDRIYREYADLVVNLGSYKDKEETECLVKALLLKEGLI